MYSLFGTANADRWWLSLGDLTELLGVPGETGEVYPRDSRAHDYVRMIDRQIVKKRQLAGMITMWRCVRGHLDLLF